MLKASSLQVVGRIQRLNRSGIVGMLESSRVISASGSEDPTARSCSLSGILCSFFVHTALELRNEYYIGWTRHHTCPADTHALLSTEIFNEPLVYGYVPQVQAQIQKILQYYGGWMDG